MCTHLDTKKWYFDSGGYITLVSVLLIGAIGSAIALSLILLGLSSSRTSFVYEQSEQAKALANACVEEAEQRIHDPPSFIGSGSLSFAQGTCSYVVASQGGSSRTVTASGTVGTVTRKVKIILYSFSPMLQITSWQEVADF